jgi:hypothetical protein
MLCSPSHPSRGFARYRSSQSGVRLRQVIHGIVDELIGFDFTALRHVDNTPCDNLLGNPPVTWPGKGAAGGFNLFPGIFISSGELISTNSGSKEDCSRSGTIAMDRSINLLNRYSARHEQI